MTDVRQIVAEPAQDQIVPLLARWLETQIPDAKGLALRDVVKPRQGFSSDTLLFTATWQDGAETRAREFVARIQRHTVCPMLADVFFQHDVMQAVSRTTTAAVPHIAFADRNGEAIGQPLFLMDRVQGRVPSDFPLFHKEGWVAALSPTDQGRLWWNGIGEMAKLHAAETAALGCIAAGKAEPPGSRHYLVHFIGTWLDWAAQGLPFPVIKDAIAYLLDHIPQGERAGLVWNDARMGNAMFAEDLNVASLFDFEVASFGPAEIDLAWWLYCEDLFSLQFGVERLPGIPGEAEAIKGFERLYGRAMPEFDYYLAIAALKHTVLAIRDYSNGKTIDTPAALPGFAMARLQHYLDRHRTQRRD